MSLHLAVRLISIVISLSVTLHNVDGQVDEAAVRLGHYSIINNARWPNSLIETKSRSLVECVASCHDNTLCAAVNHQASTKICEHVGLPFASGPVPLDGWTSAVMTLNCGSILEDGATFTSPNYPDHYENNLDCIWTITVPEDYVVTLSFQEFKIETGYDILEVRDVSGAFDRLIGRYSGHTLPADITSTSNQLYVRFRTDSSVTRVGFSATVSKVSL